MIKYSTTDINKLYDGSAAVNKMYHGSTLSFVKYKGSEPIQPMLKIEMYASTNGTLLDSISMDDDGTGIINNQKMATFVQNNPFSADVSNTLNLFKITVGDTVTEYAPYSSTTMNVYDTSGHTRNIINSTFCLIAPNVITYAPYSVYGMYALGQTPIILDINTRGATFYRNNFVVLSSSINKIDLDFSHSTFIGYNDTPNQLYFNFTNSSVIKSLILPSTITSLNRSIYACSNLEWIEMQSFTPPTIDTNDTSSLTNLPSLTAIYVPQGHKSQYQNANGWSNLASIIKTKPL